MANADLSFKLKKIPSDIIVPALVSLVMMALYIAIGYALISVFIRGVDVLSQSWIERLSDANTEYVKNVISQLRESLLRRLLIGAFIAFVAAMIWYLLLLLKPVASVGEARGRRGMWLALLSVVVIGFSALFVLPLLPMIAAMTTDTYAARAGAPLYIVSGVGGTAGISLAYWMATAVGTPKYARTAVPGAGMLPF